MIMATLYGIQGTLHTGFTIWYSGNTAHRFHYMVFREHCIHFFLNRQYVRYKNKTDLMWCTISWTSVVLHIYIINLSIVSEIKHVAVLFADDSNKSIRNGTLLEIATN